MLQKSHLATGAAEFLQKQDLVGVFACQAIRGQHGDDADDSVAHGIAQCVEAGSVEAAAAISLVAEDMLVGDGVILGGRPGSQRRDLAVDGLVALLAFGGHAGIEGGSHGKLTSICGLMMGDDGSARRRR